jgi:hypothetical protein
VQRTQAPADACTRSGLATPAADRVARGLEGLLPGGYGGVDVEIVRALTALVRARTPLSKYQVRTGAQLAEKRANLHRLIAHHAFTRCQCVSATVAYKEHVDCLGFDLH